MHVQEFAYQDVDTSRYGLTKEDCSKQVYIEHEGQISAGARAVSILLKARGNRVTALLISLSGPLGDIGYRWVATHRNSWAIRKLTEKLES